MIKYSLLLLLMLADQVWLPSKSVAQLTAAFPASEGGFQQGNTLLDNGWQVLNGAALNGWAIGQNYPGATQGSCAYITSNYLANNPSTTLVNAASIGQTVHLFRQVQLPATDSAIFLQFRITSAISSGVVQLNVHLDSTQFTITSGNPSGSAAWAVSTGVINSGNFTPVLMQVPPVFAGKLVRLRFEFRVLSGITNVTPSTRGFALDDIQLTTRPYLGSTITAAAAGGNWSATSSWIGGLLPSAGEDVVIPAGTTLQADVAWQPGGRNLSVLGTINGNNTVVGNAGNIVARGTLTVASTGNLQTRTRQIRVGGHLIAQPGAAIDLRAGGLIFDVSDLVQTERVLQLDSMGQIQQTVLANLTCSAPEGLRFEVTNTNNDTLRLYNGLTLGLGQINHGGKLLIDNTVASSISGATATSVFVLAIQRGSLVSFPPRGATSNIEIRYLHLTDQANPLIAGSRNELPPNRRFGRLTTGSAASFLRIVDDIWLTDNVNNTLWLFGPASVDSGKRVILLNPDASTGASTANNGLLQGKLVFTVNSGAAFTKRFPVGRGLIPQHMELRGITTAGEARLSVEALSPSPVTNQISPPLTALSSLSRIRVQVDSGTVSSITQLAAFYTSADGLSSGQIPQLRLARSTTWDGNYASIGPSAAPTASPVVSNSGSFQTDAFYCLALEGGSFRMMWTGAAGNGSWDTPGNWTGNRVPSTADSVVVAAPFSTIRLTGDVQVASLEVGAQSSLELNTGARLRIGSTPGTGRLWINGVGGQGHFFGIRALPGSTLQVE